MKLKKIFLLIIILFIFYSCHSNKKNKILPYTIVYQKKIFISKDSFNIGIIKFKKTILDSFYLYLSPKKSAIEIAKKNHYIYSEYYFPYEKGKITLDTITHLNKKVKNHLGWYIGKIDLFKYNNKYLEKINTNDFKFGQKQYGRIIKVGHNK